MRSSPSAGLPPEVIMKVVEKFVFQLEAQLADRGVTIELTEEAAQVAGRDGLRREVRRPAAGARHPGAHQEAAGRRAAVRQARARRHRAGAGRRRRRGAQARLRVHPRRAQGRKAKGKDERRGRRRARTRARRAPRWSRPPRARPCPAPRTRRTVPRPRRRAERPAPQGRLAIKPARRAGWRRPGFAWAAGPRNSVSESWSPPCRQPRKPVRLRGDCW